MGVSNTVQQLSVFLENREGRLEEVLDVLAKKGVNIVALSLADTSDYGMLRMIVSDPHKGRMALKEVGITSMLTDVVALRVPHATGSLNKAMHQIVDGEVNIEYMYAFANGADAAAVLYAMNRIFYMGYTLEELMDFGLRLGADVPYCLMRGTALAEGIGEELTRLPACPPCYVVIAKPAISVSTRFVYENLRLDETTRHPDIYGLADAICRQDLYGMLPYMGNVLESVTIPAYPIIGEIKERFMENGALISLMSGSGPTVFALFDNYEMALRAKEALLEWGQVPLVYVTDLYRVREETPVNYW